MVYINTVLYNDMEKFLLSSNMFAKTGEFSGLIHLLFAKRTGSFALGIVRP